MPQHKLSYAAKTSTGSPFEDADALKDLLFYRDPTSSDDGTGFVVLEALVRAIHAVTSPSLKYTVAELETELDALVNDPA